MDVEAVEGRLLGALAAWAATSALVGAGLVVAGRRADRPALAGFGLQSMVWGAVDGAAVVVQGGYLLLADAVAAAALRP